MGKSKKKTRIVVFMYNKRSEEKEKSKCFQKWEEEEGNKVWGHHALHCRVSGRQLPPPPPHQGTSRSAHRFGDRRLL